MERHIKVLMHRHSALDAKIAELSRRRGVSPSLSRLKRMRLAIKDQIEAYRRRNAPPTASA